MKTIAHLVLFAAFVTAGFAAGYPIGRSDGISTGSEWALKQAELMAREEGLFMPIRYEDGTFRVILKQPRHLYRHAWKLADHSEEKATSASENANDVSTVLWLERDLPVSAEEPLFKAADRLIGSVQFQIAFNAFESKATLESSLCRDNNPNL